MNDISTIHKILIDYLRFDFTQPVTNSIAIDCANFLASKNISSDLIKENFIIEFKIANDQSSIEIRGGNLISSLWIIGVYPENPEKYISNNTCRFQGKKYIYDPFSKSLNISEYGENARNR